MEEDGTVAKASEEATRAMARVETNFMVAIEYVNINTKLVNEIRTLSGGISLNKTTVKSKIPSDDVDGRRVLVNQPQP